MVGSTALAARFDPEDFDGSARLVLSHHVRSRREVRRFAAKYMGDGVLIYFGYPQPHEDDAERAIRRGLTGQTVRGAVLTEADIRQ